MRKTVKFNYTIELLSALLVLTGLICGCYYRKAANEDPNPLGKNINNTLLSETEVRKFQQSLRKVDGDADAHYKLALYFQERWRHKLAIDELKLVLLRNPAHAGAYNALGVSFDNLGDHEAAIDYYKLALQIDPKLDYAYNNLGYSYLLKGDNQKAVDAFQQAIALNGAEKRYRNNLGLAYVKQNNYELAHAQFSALDSKGNAEKTLVKVMKDLGKESETERVLLAIKSAPKVDPPVGAFEPVDNLPELAAAIPESASGNDPFARFQAMKNRISSFPDDELEKDTAAPANPDQAETAAEEGAGENEGVLAKARSEPLTGPVIDLAPLPVQKPREVNMASTPPDVESIEIAAQKNLPVEYHRVSSAVVSPGKLQNSRAASAAKPIDADREKPITKKPVDIPAQRVENAAAMDQEEHEERILMAASSTKAGGWQNAPEPKQSAEQGLIEVEVANGNGVKGAAGKVAEHLRRCGFKVVKVLDANSFDHISTKVFYYGSRLKDVQRLLEAIPEIAGDAELYELQNMGTRIRLLIGKDLVAKNRALTWGRPRSIIAPIGG